MAFEMQIECNECKSTTPALRMNCIDWPELLGRWIYEHSHCANQYDDESSGFTRHNENHLLNDGMQDWVFPLKGTKISWHDGIER